MVHIMRVTNSIGAISIEIRKIQDQIASVERSETIRYEVSAKQETYHAPAGRAVLVGDAIVQWCPQAECRRFSSAVVKHTTPVVFSSLAKTLAFRDEQALQRVDQFSNAPVLHVLCG
jgi:hypothetical protein